MNPAMEQTITLVTGANKGLGLRHPDRDRGADVIVRLAMLPPDGPTGTAQLREGVTTPW